MADVRIDPIHLLALPASFIIGFVIPLIPVMLPFSIIGAEAKQTAMGWYQQWPLWIAVAHYTLVVLLRATSASSNFISQKNEQIIYRCVYTFAFAFAVLTHLPVMVVSFTASVWPALFKDEYIHLLQPKHLLVPTNPFSDTKVTDLAEGMFWLIQWDYFSGYLAPAFWAFSLYRIADATRSQSGSLRHSLIRAALYCLMAGPVGIAVGMIWERDEMMLSLDHAAPLEETQSQKKAQ